MEEVTIRLDAQRERLLRAACRIVIKVGTSTTTKASGELRRERIEPMAQSISRLMAAGKHVVLVSSGAIGLGRGWLGLHRSRLLDVATRQACAAVGQNLLMNAYKEIFSKWNVRIAQVLLTADDFNNWRRYMNLRRTMEKLLGFDVLPIVNENDTVSTVEVKSLRTGSREGAFSDNDRLAALVMSGLEADALVLLTDVDGLIRKRPLGQTETDSAIESEVISLIHEVTPDLKALAEGPSTSGRGGMLTKLEAGQIAMNCGRIAVVANGRDERILDRIFAGERVGTAFLQAKRIRAKRRWIIYAAEVRGRVIVDAGARQAIINGKASLLTSGIDRVEGPFLSMDVVSIVDHNGQEIARGIANCASSDAEDVIRENYAPVEKGRRALSSHILIRRDNIVLLQKS